MIYKQFGTCSPPLLFFTDVSNCPYFPSHCTHTAHPSANSLTSSFRETEFILLHSHWSQWQAFPSCILAPRPHAPTYYLNLCFSATQFWEHFSMNKFFSSKKILPFPQFSSLPLRCPGSDGNRLALPCLQLPVGSFLTSLLMVMVLSHFTAAPLGGSLPGPPFSLLWAPLPLSSLQCCFPHDCVVNVLVLHSLPGLLHSISSFIHHWTQLTLELLHF